MNFVNKMEKKFGRYAIHNLMLYLIILYVVGFFIINTNPAFYVRYLSLDAGAILHGQIWRILTYVIYPPSTNIFWLVLASYIYYSLGRTLEQVIGTFRFNLFIFIGILGNVLAAIIIYLLLGETYLLTADNLYMSMLLAMAVTFPDMKFLLFYLIPIPAKWLGCAYGALLVYQFIMGSLASKISIVMALLNFIFYFFMVRRPVQSANRRSGRSSIRCSRMRLQQAHGIVALSVAARRRMIPIWSSVSAPSAKVDWNIARIICIHMCM